MNNIDQQSILLKTIEALRYDLLKALVFILFIVATIIYTNTESEKYYTNNKKSSSVFQEQ